MRARGGQWRRLHGERRPAAVLCRCGGVPARRGGDGRARELRWDESKRIRGLVEGCVGSSGGSAWRSGWQPWRAAALRKRRRAGLAGDEARQAQLQRPVARRRVARRRPATCGGGSRADQRPWRAHGALASRGRRKRWQWASSSRRKGRHGGNAGHAERARRSAVPWPIWPW